FRLLLGDQRRELREPVLRRCALDHAERPRDRSGRVRDCDAGARPAEVQRDHLHFRASAIACFPASSASRRPAGFLPPASASVGRPPPPPPMWRPRSRTSFTASSPRPTSDSSRFTTRYARPSSTEPTITPAAFSCCLIRSERSRNCPPLSSFVSTSRTSRSLSTIVKSAAASARGLR